MSQLKGHLVRCPYGHGTADANGALPIPPAIQQLLNISYLLHAPLPDQIGLKSAPPCDLEGFTQRSCIEVVLGW